MSNRLLYLAKNSISKARYNLELGDITMAPYEIGSCLTWALEAWLVKEKIMVSAGPSSSDVWNLFIQKGQEPLKTKALKCSEKILRCTPRSPDPIDGGPVVMLAPYGSDKWKQIMWDCLSQAEEILQIIEQEVGD